MIMKTILAIIFFHLLIVETQAQCVLSLELSEIKQVKKNKAKHTKDELRIFIREECRNDFVTFSDSEYRRSGSIKEHRIDQGEECYVLSGHKYQLEVVLQGDTITLIETKGKRQKIFIGKFKSEFLENPYDL
jgi:hypothetical protein